MFLKAWNHSEEPRSDLCVTRVNCSVHPTHHRASPVSSSPPTVPSTHCAELKRAFPNQNPSLDFSKFSLMTYDSIKCDSSWKKNLWKLSAVPHINHFLLFAFVKSSPHDPVLWVKSATPFRKHNIAAFIPVKNKVHLIFCFMLEEKSAWPSAF